MRSRHLSGPGRAPLAKRWGRVRNFERSIRIDAPALCVWALLANVEQWPSWTASVTRARFLKGLRLETGAVVSIKQPRLARTDWTVTRCMPGESFAWVSHSLGLRVRAEHTLVADGIGCTLHLQLSYQGLLAPLAGWMGAGMIERYMAMEAEGLKRRAERGG